MEDRHYRDMLEEKMRKLFDGKRQQFLNDIPTLNFMNAFPGFSDTKRQRIRCREESKGEIYANEELLDYIKQKEEFWMKYLETAEKINDCSKTASLIRDVLNANPPNPPPPSRIATESIEETDSTTGGFAKTVQPPNTTICNEQRKKEMEFASALVTQPTDSNTSQFSSKSVLANLSEITDDIAVSEVTINKEEKVSARINDFSEGVNSHETFSYNVKDRHVEQAEINESLETDTGNVSFSSTSYLAKPYEHFNSNKPLKTVKAVNDNNLNKDSTQKDVLKPVGQKHLPLSDLDDSIAKSSGEDGEDEDSESFVVSETDVATAFDLPPDEYPSLEPEIESLKLEKKDPCMAANEESSLSDDSMTKEIDGNISQSKEKLNAKPQTSGGFSMCTSTRKEPVPDSCKQFNTISCEDFSVDNSLHGAASMKNIDQQPISAVVGNQDNQESVSFSPTATYQNCIIIKSRHCQIDSKGCSIKESGGRKISQRSTAQETQLYLKREDMPMLERMNFRNTDNSNSTHENSEETLVKKPVVKAIQSTDENYFEKDDYLQPPSVKLLNQVETSSEGNTERLSGDTNDPTDHCKFEETKPEISESGNIIPSERNGSETDSNGETFDFDRDSEAGDIKSSERNGSEIDSSGETFDLDRDSEAGDIRPSERNGSETDRNGETFELDRDSEAGDIKPSERNDSEKDSNGETFELDRDSETVNHNEQSMKTFWKAFIPAWVKFEWYL